jgi:hypothetical protein
MANADDKLPRTISPRAVTGFITFDIDADGTFHRFRMIPIK